MNNIDYWLTEVGLNKISIWSKDGFSIKEIATKMGKSPSTVYLWKSKHYELDKALLCKGYKGIEIERIITTGNKKRVLYFKDGKEVRYCSKCREFVSTDIYIINGHICRNCNATVKKSERSTEIGKQKKREQSQRYYKENKFKVYQAVYRRHTALKNNVFNYNEKIWIETLQHFNNECAYCGTSGIELQKEHVIPVSKNGAFIKSNIVPSCRACNMSKYTSDFSEWYRGNNGYTVERHEKINKWTGIKNNVQQLTLL